jgi:urea carboxylase
MIFDALLVANRGEIAVRIMRTARELGLKTVAVYSDVDRGAPHVTMADASVRLGPAPARESYLRADAIVEAALSSGAGAIHPGYGFLSENADFAEAAQAAGIVFVGPTPEQLRNFGSKHTARSIASTAGVNMLPGTGVLADLAAAQAEAELIGFPVMLKATGGGGGIGMRICRTPAELAEAFDAVERIAVASFGTGGAFLERYVDTARHVEVQIFGDGAGRVRVLGDRDCSLQRRHQKVVEEAPAPGLPGAVRDWIASSAAQLCESVAYRSAGTVEYVYDVSRQEAYFLEVNTRLQVEHPVTEQTRNLDLVAWMLRLAQGDSPLDDPVSPSGHSIEARIYAEDAARDHQPSAGLLTNVSFGGGVRVDTWISAGTEVSPHYDPMLAKVIATGADRPAAIGALLRALEQTRIDGIETNLPLLRAALRDENFAAARHVTSTLGEIVVDDPRIDVLRAGTMTTVQDWPGRTGAWQVGVPPSGPMDDRSFRLGNLALGNPESAAGLECTIEGPALRFARACTVCVTGAPATVTVDGDPVPQWEPVALPAGGVLDIGVAAGPGLRTYLLVAGGLDVPDYLGSAATFTLGGFGGHGGRALVLGDVLRPRAAQPGASPRSVADLAPDFTNHWELGVTEGPHAAPEFFTREDIEEFYAASWSVHFNSARTGVRLVGPKPRWARPDGGEAGLHPSNIHDTPYAIGAVDFTGDLPVLLGPDGPSLGGFVCPATVASSQRWKLGQLRPEDEVRFIAIDEAQASALRAPMLSGAPALIAGRPSGDDGVLHRRDADGQGPSVTYRRAGDDNLLVEYGPMALDLAMRMRVHALSSRLAEEKLDGIIDVTPGIRSLQIHTDPDRLSVARILAVARSMEDELPPVSELTVPSRTIHLPLSWDDPATREAIERYMAGVRSDAPWCPWNIEFIRRVNGLDSVEDVHRTVFDASYLVLGLGDVYLGAPVATPLDPRHRLVTTKYNPARTWTPENAVGIGGAYLCIYGMEGPGGYQFVGRTVQVWSRFTQTGPFEPGSPWLLRFFDQIKWYPVEAGELLELRADLAAGRLDLETEPGEFSLGEYQRFLDDNAADIEAFRVRQAVAFGGEREAWAAAGEFDPRPELIPAPAPEQADVPTGATVIAAPFVGNIWRVEVAEGETVTAGQPVVSLEAMKLETVVTAPRDGTVLRVLVSSGTQVAPGATLVVLAPDQRS